METHLQQILERIDTLERNLNAKIDHDLTATRELVTELVRANTRQINVPQQQQIQRVTKPEELYFNVRVSYDHLEVSGKTYDIRDYLKSQFGATWNMEHKSWNIVDTSIENELCEYLRTITDKVNVLNDNDV